VSKLKPEELEPIIGQIVANAGDSVKLMDTLDVLRATATSAVTTPTEDTGYRAKYDELLGKYQKRFLENQQGPTAPAPAAVPAANHSPRSYESLFAKE
jgi:hypothetical protein